MAKKRMTIKGDTDDLGLGLEATSSAEIRGMLEFDKDVTKDIMNRERQWRNRTTVLQSTGKVGNFTAT